jgi:choline dehydrogenase-like flavoprotein
MEFDIVIIGAGSAGCVLAKRLNDAGYNVAILEAGGSDNYHWVHIPMGYLYCIDNPRTDWQFRTEPDAGLNGRSLLYPRGKVLGGCSSINGMLYLRGQAADYDGWRQMGLSGWGWDDVLPYFKKSQDYVDGASDLHGAGGEWRVEHQRLRWDVLDDWARAAQENGIPATTDFNSGTNEGVGYFKVNQRSGWRINTAKAFLRTARNAGRLKVITHAHVSKILIRDNRAVGVDYHRGQQMHRITARAQVVLSAGAIGSPQILKLSGLGPATELAQHGIDVVRDIPDVGENLQDHLQLRCSWALQGAKTLNTMANSWLGKAQIALEYALKRSGPMSMAPSQLGAFAKSRAGLDTPDLEFHVQPLSLEAFGQPLHDYPAITASVCNLRPTSRGRVALSSGDPWAKPKIIPNYLSTENDRQVAADAITLARSIMSQPAMAKYSPSEVKPGVEIQARRDLIQAAGDIGTTIFHPTCTVRMGADPAAPLDETLRLRGVDGLRVVDASVMPSIVSGNTNSPTIMIAEKAADMIIESLQ